MENTDIWIYGKIAVHRETIVAVFMKPYRSRIIKCL